MDLQWQRQCELWLRFMDAGNISPALNIAFIKGEYFYYLEAYDGRARITLACNIPENNKNTFLINMLQFLQPEAGNGVPFRAWLASGKIWLSAVSPQTGGAELWADLSRKQQRVMSRVMESYNEKN